MDAHSINSPDGVEPRPQERRRKFPDERERPDPSPTRQLGLERDLPGAVYMVPNERWGFESATSSDHPGVCTDYLATGRSAVLLKGTDAGNVWRSRGYHFIAPTPENGLAKLTAFELVPRYVKLHTVLLYYPERFLGHVDDGDLLALRDELARACSEE